MHKSVKICFYILGWKVLKGNIYITVLVKPAPCPSWDWRCSRVGAKRTKILFCTFAKVEFFWCAFMTEWSKLEWGNKTSLSVCEVVQFHESSLVAQRSLARLNLGGLSCSALTSRRFSRGSWQRSSASSRWNRSWPWCGRWPCQPPSRGCPPPLGGSLGWPSSAAPPLQMGSAGRKPKATRWRRVTFSFYPKIPYLFSDKRTELQHFTSSPASFFTTCWADNTLVAAIADARLCKNEQNKKYTRSMMNSNSTCSHF